MRSSLRKRIICGLVVTAVLAGIGIALSGRRAPPPVVGYDRFLSTLSFVRHEDGEPIADLIELEKETGLYVDVSFIPREMLPQELDDQPIQDPSAWPFTVRIYPRSDRDAANAIELRVVPYQSRVVVNERLLKQLTAGSAPPPPVTRGTTGFWQEKRGYHGPPSPPKTARKPPGERRLWTFLNPDLVTSGEHVFELVMYPTARFLSKVRSRSGDPVILCRGIVRLKG